jgi:hypothetical protein
MSVCVLFYYISFSAAWIQLVHSPHLVITVAISARVFLDVGSGCTSFITWSRCRSVAVQVAFESKVIENFPRFQSGF